MQFYYLLFYIYFIFYSLSGYRQSYKVGGAKVVPVNWHEL